MAGDALRTDLTAVADSPQQAGVYVEWRPADSDRVSHSYFVVSNSQVVRLIG